MAFLLYFVGFIVFIAGMGWMATALGAPQAYVLPGAIALLFLGLFTAFARTRSRDPS